MGLLWAQFFFGAQAVERYGEALHPGPSSYTFHLGTVNVAGAASKASAIAALPHGIWGITESHLTVSGIGAVRGALRQECAALNRNSYTVFGAPVPPRAPNSSAGTWAGVFTHSNFPLRALRASHDSVPHLAGRLHFSSTFVNQVQITGACLYGAAQGPTYRNAVQITSDIQDLVSNTLVRGFSGPRYIQGDFNTTLMETLPTQEWHAAGWREIQDLLHETSQTPIRPTCKKTTTRDFLWLSPELIPFVQTGGVLEDLFPDHDAVYAVLSLPHSAALSRHWPMALPIDWTQVQKEAWHDACGAQPSFTWSTDTTADFMSWSRRVEDSLSGFVGGQGGSLPHAQKGRAQTLTPKIGQAQLPHVKPARPGEEALQTSFLNRAVFLHYKQLRRLQSLWHCVKKERLTPNAQVYASQLWQAIIHAAGFEPTSRSWWKTRLIHLQGSPLELPLHCPLAYQVELIFNDFKRNFRALETWHVKKRSEIMKTRRESSLKHLFRGLREDSHEGLNMLYRTTKLQVLEVDLDRNQILLNTNLDLSEGFCEVDGNRHELERLDIFGDSGQSTWFAVPEGLVLDSDVEVIHKRPCTSFEDIQQELLQLWLPRWQLPEQLPAEQWQRILAFAAAYIPKNKLEVAPLTSSTLRRALTAGKTLRTRGADGWDKVDFRNMPTCYLDEIAELYGKIESGASWPQQIIRGHIHCIEKCSDANLAGQYRPITLFGMPYRWWSTVRARALLPQLSRMVHFNAFGYLEGRSSALLAFQVQAQIESAISTAQHISGVTTDLEKCFNFLQRGWVFQLGEQLGIDSGIIAAWSSFLSNMPRAFVIRNEIGIDSYSTNGFPEGDSLSCVALLVMTFALHCYMLAYQPSATTWSYVDNIQLTSQSAATITQSFLVLDTWAQLFGLTLDCAKTLYWSTDAASRRILQALGCKVIEGGRDLGIAMVYGARLRNASLQKRIQKVDPLWRRLRAMKASPWHKNLAVRMALLPKALYGCSHTMLGRCWIVHLRTKVMRALGWDRPGANPALRLSCLAPISSDPGYFELLTTMREFHSNVASCQTLKDLWHDFVLRGPGKATHGPFTKMESLCHMLHWHLDEFLVLHLCDGLQLRFVDEDFDIIELLLAYQWRQIVANQLGHRKDFQGLEGFNVAASFFSPKNCSPADAELLNCIRDGTFHLRTFKSKFDHTVDDACQHCGCLDTLSHRALECPHFQKIRDDFPDCVQRWSNVPVALSHHGLTSANPLQWQYWTMLQQIPSGPPVWKVHPADREIQHIFSDGSCRDPTNPYSAIASWAIVSANLGIPIASGILPGVRQTINRAELFAVFMAVHWAWSHGVPIFIWSDSSYVVNGMFDLLESGALPSDGSNVDLWRMLADLIVQCDQPIRIDKVKAHRQVTADDSTQLRWQTYFNNMVDVNAKAAALHPHIPGLALCRQDLQIRQRDSEVLAERYQSFLLCLAKHALETSVPVQLDMEEEPFDALLSIHGAPNHGELVEQFPISLDLAFNRSQVLTEMGHGVCHLLAAWLRRVSEEADHCLEVTLLEACAGFILDGNSLPFLVTLGGQSVWTLPTECAAGELLGVTFAAKLSSFSRLLRAFVSACHVEIEWGHSSRIGSGIVKTFPTIFMPWSARVAGNVHTALAAFTVARKIRTSADLARPFP